MKRINGAVASQMSLKRSMKRGEQASASSKDAGGGADVLVESPRAFGASIDVSLAKRNQFELSGDFALQECSESYSIGPKC